MNAKKIMGAVLVALLAAALFVGAGAAAITADVDGDIVFVNQKVSKDNYSGNWVGPNGAYVPGVVANENNVSFSAAGTYTAKVDDKTVTITVKAPELTITGVAGTEYTFIPGDFYKGGQQGTIYIENPSGVPYTLYYTTPAGTQINPTTPITVLNGADLGQYTIQAEFAAANFTVGTTPEQRITAPVTFSVVSAEKAVTISAAETTVLKSESIKLTVTGQPGATYNVTYANADAFLVSPQIGFTFQNISGNTVGAADQKNGIQFQMPAGGKATFTLKANSTSKSSEKITVQGTLNGAKQASVVINFEKGTISAQAEKATYFVGDEIKITGTSTAGDITYIAINGTNFGNATFYTSLPLTLNGNEFEFTFDTGDIVDGKKLLDVGTYTLSIGNGNGVNATVPLTLKQPFINIISAPEVVVQGEEDVEIIINAEAAPMIGYYIFGNNFYYYNEETTHVTEDDGTVVKNQFKITLDSLIPTMAAGQYFAVFQHPMNNEVLDVYGNKTDTADWVIQVPTGQNINVDKRQTANAAQALCDALDAQGIDDMYVKATFFVSDKDNSFSMSEIPATVAQGETITISGVDTVNKGKPVVVEMLSSAFTAVPKEDENAAAFIVVTTTIADDGTWEVTLDTSALNVDEYNVAVKIAGEIEKTATVNVVEAEDEPETPVTPEQPEQPEQPEEPVAPATPGFGALAALAGLGAVAVLLLRRE